MRRYLAASVACGALISAATVASAWVLAHIVAGVITDPATRSLSHWSGQLSILVALWIIRSAGSWLQARMSQRAATAVIGELSAGVLHSVTERTPQDLVAVRAESAVILTRGLDGLRPYFTGYLPAVALAGILTPLTVVVIAATDLQAALIVSVALPLVPLFMILIGRLTADRSAAALAAMTTLQSRLLDLVAGIPTLRALGRAGGPAHRIAELAAAHRRSAMATLRIAFLSAAVLELLATLGVALVAVSVGLRLVFGEMTLAAGLTALLLAPEVFWPLRRVGVQFHAAQDGKTAADAARRLRETVPARNPGARTPHGRIIVLDEVTVIGRDGPAPDRLTARAVPGEVTVLAGPNGTGKSTAFDVILGLTPATAGRVLIGDTDIADVDLRTWWAQVSWLPQRPVLLPGTVRANLELFGPLTDLEKACREAGFDEVLATLPDGLDTLLGRGGVGLSQGQRQRLGLARALGSAAPVLLLDEPTAHLDAGTERRVLAAIGARAHARATVLMIGHRAPVLAAADRVITVGGAAHVPS
ncbi:thiol reductant ABC exporter subunit CydD [Mycolicibacterium canariasense]|nr:thiol reductant ABC exporter subunit CydD [Mycolicibacterium canariasense]MCV7212234.1 thiol reductant ABC exporter subunit CydD [Mycolicibacterium canariasense]ORV02698.1 ABC transporter ATP-binding protein [Mycolicibacterium canariasense]